MATVGKRPTKHCERMRSLLNTENGDFDITFVIGSNAEKVKAHKLILKAHSTVFYKIFENCKDGMKQQVRVEIPEATASEFRVFLEFIYTGTFSGNTHASQLLKYAVYYEIPDLQEWCCSVLEGAITMDSVVKIYEVACNHERVCLQLKTKALDFILKNGNSILKSDNFLNFTSHNLFKVLASDHLQAPNETQVFEAMLRWGKEQCRRNGLAINGTNLRNAMTDLIPLIRFPVMNKSDFSFLVAPAEILTTEELIKILLYFNLDESKRPEMAPGPFNPVERVWFKVPPTFGVRCGNEEYICERLVPVGNHPVMIQYYDNNGRPITRTTCVSYSYNDMRGYPNYTGSSHEKHINPMVLNGSHCIRFRVNSSVWISSIGINSVLAMDAGMVSVINGTVTFAAELLEATSKKVITSATKEFSVNDLSTTKQLSFLQPVKIRANDSYTVTFRISKGSYKPVWYVIKEGTGAEVQVVAGGSKTITFVFEEELPRTYPSVTGLKQGFIPTIGFKLDATDQ